MRSLALLALVACAEPLPAGQIALHVDTDAPITPLDRLGLFDTLRVDVYAPGADRPCERCARTFSITSEQFRARAVSIGVQPAPGVGGRRARLRLFSSRASEDGQVPRVEDDTPPPSVVDTTIALPPVGLAGIVDVRVRLRVEDVGSPRGTLSEPEAAELGVIERSEVDTFGPRLPCANEPRAGEVCVPGGVFRMGNPRVRAPLSARRVRIVSISPFFIDVDLVTVRDFRGAKMVPPITHTYGNGDLNGLLHVHARSRQRVREQARQLRELPAGADLLQATREGSPDRSPVRVRGVGVGRLQLFVGR